MITIHRGENQIGGSIVEISAGGMCVLLDCGAELDEESPALPPQVKKRLESGEIAAVFFSHNHADHNGLAGQVPADIPMYIGAKSLAVLAAQYGYWCNLSPAWRASLEKRGLKLPEPMPENYLAYQSGRPVQAGAVTVTPYLCDHAAFDSHMLLVEAGGERILYTGDFRAHGRKPFDALLRRLPDKVDTLLCEGTTLGRAGHDNKTEAALEEELEALLREHDGPVFVLCAGSNIDRIVTLYRAAARCKRLFLEDVYTANVCAAAGEHIPNPRDFENVKVFQQRPGDHELLQAYPGRKRIGLADIAQERFVMIIRRNHNFQHIMRRLLEGEIDDENRGFKGAMLVYSMWEGYKQKPEMQQFLSLCGHWGMRMVSLHTSGHADEAAIRRLVEKVNPGKILPVHTETPRGSGRTTRNCVDLWRGGW